MKLVIAVSFFAKSQETNIIISNIQARKVLTCHVLISE